MIIIMWEIQLPKMFDATKRIKIAVDKHSPHSIYLLTSHHQKNKVIDKIYIYYITMSNNLWLSQELATQIVTLQKRLRLPNTNILLTSSPSSTPKHRSLTKRVTTQPAYETKYPISLTPSKSSKKNMTELIRMNKTNRQQREKNKNVRDRRSNMYQQELKRKRERYLPHTAGSNRKVEYIHAVHNRDVNEDLINFNSLKEECSHQLKWLINNRNKNGIISRISRMSHQQKQNQMAVEAHSMMISSMFYTRNHISRNSTKRQRNSNVKVIESKKYKNSVRTEQSQDDELEPWSSMQLRNSKKMGAAQNQYHSLPMDLCS